MSPSTRAATAARFERMQANELAYLTHNLWDDWSQSKIAACLDATEVDVRRLAIAAEPVRRRLDELGRTARETALGLLQDRIRAALAHPETAWRRALRRVTGFLMTALPAAALAWIAYNVVAGYFKAASEGRPYLGNEFAIHSALLLLVAWAVPFVADRLLRPELERVLLVALRAVLRDGLTTLSNNALRQIEAAAAEAHSLRTTADTLLAEIHAATRPPETPVGVVAAGAPGEAAGAALRRFLASETAAETETASAEPSAI